MRLESKVALVTGSSRGIGRELALGLAREGADIIVNYHQREDAARKTASEIERIGRRAVIVQAGVTVRSEVGYLIQTGIKELGRLDILINNAGSFPIKPFSAVSEEEWDRVMTLDLKSVFLCCKEALDPMRRQGGGRIVNIASVSGLVGAVGMVPYSAAKGGAIAFTKALARELAPLRITVNAIAPGIIETDTAMDIFPPGALDTYTTYHVPLGRLGQPKDVIGLAVFLASSEASYITGQVYAVDGGYTMQ
jgi:3-oxoacyl-[acyl-carrier protein] reductase